MAVPSSLPAISNTFKPFIQTPKPTRTRTRNLTTHSSLTSQPQSLSSAKTNLLNLISDQNRGLKTQDDPKRLAEIGVAIESIALMNRDQVTTNNLLSGTWRLLWTTEKEQLFIIKNADFFGTEAGDVLQVIDVENKSLNNVITFPPDGVFFVRSGIEIASDQRVNFSFLVGLQVRFYVGKIGSFHCHHLVKDGLIQSTWTTIFELLKIYVETTWLLTVLLTNGKNEGLRAER